jgi:predicted regulator of Ras-like GTPase activity (Roadblock/LC7/MglB family)
MIKNLPEGISIGEMRASLQWILSHTARFAGLVRVTIQGSRGFILINMGKPLFYYFRHGHNILKGHTAYEYFLSQPLIQFELRKYTALEMTLALGLASAAEATTDQSTVRKPVKGVTTESPELPVTLEPYEGSPGNSDSKADEAVGDDEGVSMDEMDSSEYSAFAKGTISYLGLSQNVISSREEEHDPALFPHVPLRTIGKLLDTKKTDVGDLILGQIINLPGVLAVTIFRRGLNVLSIGEIDPDNLVDVAEDLINSAKGLSSVMRTGPFIQVTLQIPAGNIIIAPYYDEYVCILTSPGINLGQIRKIIRELPGVEIMDDAGEAF